MAIGWLTVLQSVPWAEVVSNAPKVAAGAKKLWNAVGKKPPAPSGTVTEGQMVLSPEARAIAVLEARIGELQAASAELQGQMMASSELIKALAEQNTQLILRIETLHVRLRWLAGALAVTGLIAAAGVVLMLVR
jgi:hypothetical protein